MNKLEIKKEIWKMANEVVQEEIPHVWVYEEEILGWNEWKNQYAVDISGNTFPMTIKNCKDLSSSSIELLFEEIVNGEWVPSYERGRGKNWITYENVLSDKWFQYKHSKFSLIDEDGNELNPKLEERLDNLYFNFMKTQDAILLKQKIINKLK